MTMALLKKETVKRESESLLMAAQNNATRTNYIERKAKNTRKNC